MRRFRAMLHRLRGLFRRRAIEAEMNAELQAHLDGLTERNCAAGMSPEDARCAAMCEFGGVAQVTELARDQRRSVWVEQLWHDLRYAARSLRKTPIFTAVAMFSLALGIGANTAIFSALNRVLLRPLPVSNSGELVRFQWMAGVKGARPPMTEDDVGWIDSPTHRPIGTVFSLAAFEAFHANHPALAEVFAFVRARAFIVEIDGQTTEGGRGQVVSGGYHTGLGVKARLGRVLLPDDDRPEAPPVAVISHGFWQRRFGGDGAVIGKTILVNRAPVMIVGVMPPGFDDPLSVFGEQVFTFPWSMLSRLEPDLGAKSMPDTWWIRIMGRLQPDASMAQAAASLQAAFAASTQDGVTEKDDPPQLLVAPGGYGLTESRWTNAFPLLVLTGMGALVLLAACANLANLLLARGATRRRELAMRLALGAGRGRLIRQLLTESGLLAFLGSALGLLLAWWGGALLPLVGAGRDDVVDFRVFGFATAVTFLAALVFGWVPALRATRLDLTAEFQGSARELGGGSRTRLSQSLLVVQVALSLVLLVGAGLFVRTLRNLQTVDIGFARDNLLLFSLDAAAAGYPPEQFTDLHRRVAERIGVLPGVRALTFSSTPVLAFGGHFYRTEVPGRLSPAVGDAALLNKVGADFFSTFGISVVTGRVLEAQDNGPASNVAVVNQTFVNHFFPGEHALGRRFRQFNREREIVGVVRDVQQGTLRTPPVPTVFVPFAESPPGTAHFALRTIGDPDMIVSAIRGAVREIEPSLPVAHVRTQEQQLETMLAQERAFAQLAGIFGGLALALVCIGLFGLMSYGVQRRTGEIGLRIALGALPSTILRMILRESLVLVLLGCGLGIAGAAAAVRLVGHLLFNVSPTDVPTYAAVILLTVFTSVTATLLPARRAAKVEPTAALRAE